MHIVQTVGKTLACTAAILMLAVPVMAGNGNGGKGISSGQGTGTRTQTRTPGSCKDTIEKSAELQQLAGNGKGHGLKDGSGTKPQPKDGTGFGAGSHVIEQPGSLDSGYLLTGNGNGGSGNIKGFGPGDGTGDGICDLDCLCDNA